MEIKQDWMSETGEAVEEAREWDLCAAAMTEPTAAVAIHSQQACAVVAHSQSQAAMEDTHPVLNAGETMSTARQIQQLQHKARDLSFEIG